MQHTKRHNWRGRVLSLSKIALLCLPQMALASTVTIMQSEPPRSMDPGDQTATYTFNMLDPMYEGLVRFNKEKQIIPALATSWENDKTGKVWTFTLRKDVTFHDGTPFNAKAVVYNIQRHLDKSRGLAASGRLRNVIASVKAQGDDKVVITLKKTFPTFLNLMTSGAAMMVSPKADKAGTLSMQADGTGPYEFVKYKTGEYVLEKRNPDYWGKTTGADDLKWTWSEEMSVMNMAIQSGEADVINPVPPQFARLLQNNPNVSLNRSPGSAVFWVALDTKMKPLNDIRVRQALNFATNRDTLVKAVSFGYAKPANSPLASIAPGYDTKLNDYPYNIEKAKTLLKEAGYPNGFSMSIAVQGPDARTAQVLQAMWKKIGVQLDVKQMESGVWTKAAFANAEEKAKLGVSSVLASWSSGLVGNDNQLRPLYDSRSFAPSGANLGFYKNSEVDKLIDQASSSLDENKRAALYVKLQKLISHDAPQVLLYYQDDLYASGKNIKGVEMIPGGNLVVRNATTSAQ
ncbi:ABC transporter substrate-binding protein [Vibrio nitrifigilis]|uniref:Glycosyl transferase n=1 Tax=Vibrio nitrifigilis TaxID=2789781 RepID=A0ABS0GJ53_9VIBR|nr:ABC transporter substrate-binding protein [Vibrio nitrifigilis]MBF9002367.1 glycosyl transferase [Vibrio nitrifigilis]